MSASRIRDLSIAAAVGALLMGGSVFASSGTDGATTTACLTRAGYLRIPSSGECRRSETVIELPSGPQGLEGEQGPQGEQGIQGERGANGSDGLSAYDVWRNAGNTGTMNDFLTSLVGPAGPKGDIGLTGPQGATGPQGSSGAGGYQAFTSDGTFTVPAGVNRILVEAWGGGGNSFTYVNARGDTCGGGSGQYVRTFVPVVPGQALKVTIGTGGSGAWGLRWGHLWGRGSAGSSTALSSDASVVLVNAAGGSGTGNGDLCASVASEDTSLGTEYTLIRQAGPPTFSLLPAVFDAGGVRVSNSVTGFVCCNLAEQDGGPGQLAIEW
jgi:hypothetical protein